MQRSAILYCTIAAVLVFNIPAGAQSRADNVGISGVVLDAESGAPVAFATIRIAALRINSAPPGTPPQFNVVRPMLQQSTDADGRFILEDFEPGTHNVVVLKDGYETRNKLFTIKSGGSVKDAIFRIVRLPAPGVVTGRVVDSSGQPIASAPVELLQYRYESHASLGAFSDHPELWNVAGGRNGGQTDDRGIFRISNVPPGEYFLRILPPGEATDELSPLGAIFFPGVNGLSRAEKLKVESGSEVQVGTFSLLPSALQPVRVLVTNSTGERTLSSRATIEIFADGTVPEAPPVQRGMMYGVPAVRPDEPGRYIVCGSVVVNDAEVPNVAFSRHACTSIDYTGVALDVPLMVKQPQGRLVGRVLLEHTDGTTPTPLAGISISALGQGPGTNFGATSSPDGTFRSIGRVHEEPAVLKSIQVPDGYFVVSARQGTRDVLVQGLLVLPDSSNIEILVSPEGGTLRGRVTNAKGDPVDGATVALSPDGDLSKRTDKQDSTPIARSGDLGEFEIKGIIPGSYHAYAFGKIEGGAYWDSNFLKTFAERGKPIQIEKNGNSSIDLKLADETIGARTE